MTTTYMIRKTIYAACACLLLAAGIALPAGCADDAWVKSAPKVAEGVPVTARMKVSSSPGADIVVTRVDNSLSELYDLTLFVFDGDGKFQHSVSTYDGTLQVNDIPGDEVGRGTIREVTFETTSGVKKMLAMGNLFSSYWWVDGSTNMQTLRDANEGKYTFDELEKIVFELSVLTSDPGDRPNFYMPVQMAASEQMMVSGCNENLAIDTDGTVTNWGTEGSSVYNVGIAMQRSMARITFNIPADPSGSKGEFIPNSYTVYNIPKMSYVVNSHDTPALTPQKDPDGVEQQFIHYSTTNIPSASGGNYTFAFYMPENTYERAGEVTVYTDRDRWGAQNEAEGVDGVTGATPLRKAWTNAPQTSTFVVIRGTYSGSATVGGATGSVTADVSYTVHLGDFSDSGSMGDFSVKRNCSYTYTVNVLGVDNIIVEAQVDGSENQPGSEGSVYDTDNVEYSYNLDAHYEQIYLEYNLSTIAQAVSSSLAVVGANPTDEQIDEEIAKHLVLVIQSEAMDHNRDGVSNKRGSLQPYKLYADAVRGKSDTEAESAAKEAKEGILAGAGSNGKPTKGYDYKWVEFWPQSDKTIADYPGISEWAREKLTADADHVGDFMNKDYYYASDGASTDNSRRLMDVYDIIVEMGKVVKQIYNQGTPSTGDTDSGIIVSRDGSNYVARFTAFVNEYYYLRHPLTGEKAAVWSTFTNKIPRQMIIAVSSDISSDGNSSYSKIYSYISQLSMQTFYNSRVTSLSAFGIETYNETPLTIKFGTPQSSNGLSDSDGRENQKQLIGFKSDGIADWSTFIDAAQNGWSSSENTVTDHVKHKLGTDAYKTGAYAACLSRNRDLNGNGKIDENEIRWFLASVNGYIRMGIGSNAISNAAQLYIGDKEAMTKSGYAGNYINQGSLFYTSSEANKRIYWAVEKGSYGKDGETWTGGDNPKPIRCIRTLPKLDNEKNMDLSSLKGVTSDPVYESIKDENGMTVLKFKDRLSDQLYRQRVNGSLGPHDEDDATNSFSEGIFIATGQAGIISNQTMANIIGISGTMTNPCSTYQEGGYSGWRVPNLVEFMAMERAGFLTNGMACCTQFSNQAVRFCFIFNTYVMCDGEKTNSINNLDPRSVRCVRDVPADYFDNDN